MGAVAVVVGVLSVSGAASASPPAQPAYTKLPAQLTGVTAVADDSAWAVGYDLNDDDAFLDHWDGTQWTPVDHPASRSSAAFIGVSASSPSDVWAVGSHYVGPKNGKDSWTYIQHFDGTRWHRVPGANPSRSIDVLSAVSARTTKDAWAVGFQSATEQSPGLPLAEHWNGTTWSALKVPPFGSGCYGGLTGVTTIAADDVWAVGAQSCDGYTHTLVEHWDGRSWSIVDSPNPGGDNFNLLNKVAALGTDDVWAVGAWSDGSQETHPLALHWDGHAWKVVKVPTGSADSCGTPGASLIDIATDGTHLTAVGGSFCDQAVGGLVETWNGSAWKVVKSPSPHDTSPPFAELVGVSVVGGSSAVAVGETNLAGGGSAGFGEHWDGHAWKLD